MTDSNDIKDKMKSVEMNQIDNKKVWVVPELEVLDNKKTFGGPPNQDYEDDSFCSDCNIS